MFAEPDTGEPLRDRALIRRYRRTLKAAELDTTHRFHDLRHTFGTAMAAAGVPPRTLQEWMGHRHPLDNADLRRLRTEPARGRHGRPRLRTGSVSGSVLSESELVSEQPNRSTEPSVSRAVAHASVSNPAAPISRSGRRGPGLLRARHPQSSFILAAAAAEGMPTASVPQATGPYILAAAAGDGMPTATLPALVSLGTAGGHRRRRLRRHDRLVLDVHEGERRRCDRGAKDGRGRR